MNTHIVNMAVQFALSKVNSHKDMQIAQEIIALAEKNIKPDVDGHSYSGKNASAYYALDDAHRLLRLDQYMYSHRRAICAIRYMCGIAHPDYHYAKALASQSSWQDTIYGGEI